MNQQLIMVAALRQRLLYICVLQLVGVNVSSYLAAYALTPGSRTWIVGYSLAQTEQYQHAK